jgi:transcription elongation GreA/GreB family factor
MSRAFVKDQDGAEPDDLPERPVSTHRNLVTPDGLARIEQTVRGLSLQLAEARAADDKAAIARVERDLRYWTRRRATAELVPPIPKPERVRFGCRVELETDTGERVSFRIVGEDESDPSQGLISYVSPVAALLIGAKPGDRVPFRGGRAEIVRID